MAEAGLQEAELPVQELMELSEQRVGWLGRYARELGLGLTVFSGLVPMQLRITSPDFSMDEWRVYFDRAAGRAAEVGCEMIPLGAGKCRSIYPEYGPSAVQQDRVRRFSAELCRIFLRHGLTLVIEPLGRPYSNYLNRIGETEAFVHTLGHPNCAVMCDLRHMEDSREPWKEIPRWRACLRHAHVDYPIGAHRLLPQDDDGYNYAPYFGALAASGYRGIVTVEATDDDLSQLQRSADFLRRLGEQAGL